MDIISFDSTEKCGGTSIKSFLRKNFIQSQFFDLDNGDPPTETIRNYGVECSIGFYGKRVGMEFYPEFIEYLSERARWIVQAKELVNVKCIYGNMIEFTDLLRSLRSRGFRVFRCKVFRDPVVRVLSEYEYVKQHLGHNLHSVAMSAGSIEGYITHPDRPKNRQTASVLGCLDPSDCNSAISKVTTEYHFVGYLDSLEEGLQRLSIRHNLDASVVERRNVAKSGNRDQVLTSITDLLSLTDPLDVQLYESLRESYYPFKIMDS